MGTFLGVFSFLAYFWDMSKCKNLMFNLKRGTALYRTRKIMKNVKERHATPETIKLADGLYYGRDGRRLKKAQHYNKMSRTRAKKGVIRALRQKETEYAHEINQALRDSQVIGYLGEIYQKLSQSGEWFNFEHFLRTIRNKKELGNRCKKAKISLPNDVFNDFQDSIRRSLRKK